MTAHPSGSRDGYIRKLDKVIRDDDEKDIHWELLCDLPGSQDCEKTVDTTCYRLAALVVGFSFVLFFVSINSAEFRKWQGIPSGQVYHSTVNSSTTSSGVGRCIGVETRHLKSRDLAKKGGNKTTSFLYPFQYMRCIAPKVNSPLSITYLPRSPNSAEGSYQKVKPRHVSVDVHPIILARLGKYSDHVTNADTAPLNPVAPNIPCYTPSTSIHDWRQHTRLAGAASMRILFGASARPHEALVTPAG